MKLSRFVQICYFLLYKNMDLFEHDPFKLQLHNFLRRNRLILSLWRMISSIDSIPRNRDDFYRLLVFFSSSFFNSAIIYLRLLFRAIELSNENVEKFEERIGKRETEEFRFIDRAEHREYVHRAFYFPR